MADVPVIRVNGIEEISRPIFFKFVSNSKIFKGISLFLLSLEIIYTIFVSNYKAEYHRTSNIFKEIHIFLTFAFLIEFIINFFAKPPNYYKKLRNYTDFLALIFSIISIYYENYTNLQRPENLKEQIDFYSNRNIRYINSKNLTPMQIINFNNENLREYRKRRKMMKSPVVTFIKYVSRKMSSICLPRNSPFSIIDALQSIRLVRIFYMNNYLKSEFKSFLKVTVSAFPILFLFSLCTVFFGFVGFYIYGKNAPSLFGNIFISIFTVFGVSTKDNWVKNTKTMNKKNIEMQNKSPSNEIRVVNNKYWLMEYPKQRIFRVLNYDEMSHNSILSSSLKEFKKFILQNIKNANNDETSNKNNESNKSIKNKASKSNNDKNSVILNMNENETKNDVNNKTESKFIVVDSLNLKNVSLIYNKENLTRMQIENLQKYKAKTIIHHSREIEVSQKKKTATYTVWFSVSIVTVLGTILSAFIASQVTDTFTSGTEILERKEKRKAIRKVMKLLRKYNNQFNLIDRNKDSKQSNPEKYLSDQQFVEMIDILSYLKKSKERLQSFIKDNKILILNKEKMNYNYNYMTEYYNQDYYQFGEENDLNKEVLKRRRNIEQLEINLQYYLQMAQNAFAEEVLERKRKNKNENNSKSENLVSFDDDDDGVIDVDVIYEADNNDNNLTDSNFFNNVNKTGYFDGSSDNKLNDADKNLNNDNSNRLNDSYFFNSNENLANSSFSNNNKLNEDDRNRLKNSDGSNMDATNSINIESRFNADDEGQLIDLDNRNKDISQNESMKPNEEQNKNVDSSKDKNTSLNETEEISVKDYSEAFDSSDANDAIESTGEKFECFGAAAEVKESDFIKYPEPPTSKKNVIFNEQYIKSLKIALSHLINDMVRYIDLQSVFITSLSELSRKNIKDW